jgi:2-oxo-4-hydroxy-4-carboxy-5-ureidoimidazoline decarboxylase
MMPTLDQPSMSSPNLASHALARLNRLPEQEARILLQGCCGSRRWAARVAGARPFADPAALLAEADAAWDAATPADVREAIAAHPRIGAPQDGGEQERSEQAAAAAGDASVLAALREGNRAYEQRFGFVYLVFASGRGAEELLADLQARLGHGPHEELAVAAGEQRAITRLRLERLLAG